jgi:hypothetical protein
VAPGVRLRAFVIFATGVLRAIDFRVRHPSSIHDGPFSFVLAGMIAPTFGARVSNIKSQLSK